MDEIDEVLNLQQRQARKMIMRRYQNKIERAKELAKKRMAPDKNIKKRAYAEARQIVRKRFAGKKGAEYEKLGPSEKISIDRAIEKKQALIKRIALRLIPRVKAAEQKRLQSFVKGQALVNTGTPEGHTKVNESFMAFAEKFDTENEKAKLDTGPDEGKTKTVKSKSKNPEIKYYNKFGEQTIDALDKKAEKSGIDVEVLGEVYNRGLDAWNNHPKVTREQYAFARVNSFINKGKSYYAEDADLVEETIDEKSGLWDNIHAKRKRIKAGSGERMRKPGSEGAPTAKNFKDAQESFDIDEGTDKSHPIVKEYDSLKKHDIKTLRGMINQHHKVIDTSEFKTKDHAISHLLRQKHGNKKVDQAFGFNEEVELEESFRKWQIQQNLGKSKKEFLSPPNTVGGMATKRIHHNEKHDIEVYHGMQVYKTTPHYVFHKDKLVHMTTSRDNAMNHAEKLGKKLDKEEKKSVKEEVELEEANKYSVHKGKEGWYVNQHTDNGVWNHSVQTGYHDSKNKAVAWAKKHAGNREHTIDIKEEVLDEAQKFGKHIGTVNGYHIHDLGANTPHKAKRYLAYHNSYGFISHTAPTKTEINKKSKERDTSTTPKPRTEHDDWRDEQKHRISSGEVRRSVMSRRGVREEVEVEESNNTPYVRPHIEKGSTKQIAWKASNKHGRVKYFGMDFKKSAEKHAGIDEACDCTEKEREDVVNVARPTTKKSVLTKQGEIEKKIIESSQALDESFNIAFASGVGVTLTAADLGMKAQGGFALHPSVIAEMEERELEEDAESALKKPVYMPPRRRQDGSFGPAKTVLRKTGKKIIDNTPQIDADTDPHDGQ